MVYSQNFIWLTCNFHRGRGNSLKRSEVRIGRVSVNLYFEVNAVSSTWPIHHVLISIRIDLKFWCSCGIIGRVENWNAGGNDGMGAQAGLADIVIYILFLYYWHTKNYSFQDHFSTRDLIVLTLRRSRVYWQSTCN